MFSVCSTAPMVGDRQVGLEVLLVVPHEGGDPLVAVDAERAQGVGQPPHAPDLGVGLARMPSAGPVTTSESRARWCRAISEPMVSGKSCIVLRMVMASVLTRAGCRPEPVLPGKRYPDPCHDSTVDASPSLWRMRPRRLRRLNGLKVFVTGAGSGIGRATAEAVAARGGRLFLTDIDADGLAATVGDGPRGARWSLAEAGRRHRPRRRPTAGASGSPTSTARWTW